MSSESVTVVPISEIVIINPRSRNRITFESVVASIKAVGLKRPITVSRRIEPSTDGHKYDLICGQGRIEAFLALGETEIPAIIKELSKEDCLLRSLAENIARRHASSHALFREVQLLKSRGYKYTDIATKLGIHFTYAHELVNLADKGETQLLKDIEARRIPLTVAITIANGTDAEIQRALSDAYQNGHLRGSKLATVKKIIARRKAGGGVKTQLPTSETPKLSSASLIKEYRRHTQRQRALVQRAMIARRRILIATSAMKQLLNDENFRTLLRAETLMSMPSRLDSRSTQD